MFTQHRWKFLRCYRYPNIGERSVSWLLSASSQWGLIPNSPPRAANIAEILIALHTAKRVLGANVNFNSIVESLLIFRSKDGGWVSDSFGVSTVHTTALAIYALSLHEDCGVEIVNINQEGSKWLLQNVAPDQTGWSTFGNLGEIRIVPSIWAFIALNKTDNFPTAVWNNFRDKLLATKSIGFDFSTEFKSQAAAGWLMWLLSFLKQRAIWSDKEELLLDKCIQQLLEQEQPYLGEQEGFIIDEGGPKSKQNVWVRWIHATSAATTIGALPWLSIREDTWAILGRSISFLMQQANQGVNGNFVDNFIEQSGGIPFVFPTIYGTWSICETIQYISGALIDKIGIVTIRDKKVLLLLKRGTSQLIMPGGAREEGENDTQALKREVKEELGCTVSKVKYWKTFEDAAAYEKGATVRITAFFGNLDAEPEPKAEIAELVWVGSKYPDDKLSPIIRNKILPELIKAGLIE